MVIWSISCDFSFWGHQVESILLAESNLATLCLVCIAIDDGQGILAFFFKNENNLMTVTIKRNTCTPEKKKKSPLLNLSFPNIHTNSCSAKVFVLKFSPDIFYIFSFCKTNLNFIATKEFCSRLTFSLSKTF